MGVEVVCKVPQRRRKLWIFDPSLRIKSSLAPHVTKAYFESYVKCLGSPFSTSQTMRIFLIPNQGMHMGHGVPNPGLTHARLP